MGGKLYKELYDFNVSDLYPLSKVTTEEERESLCASGYMAGYTLDEWKAAFPKIDPSKVFYLSGLNADTAYYDGIIYLSLHIYGRQILMAGREEELQKRVVRAIAEQEAKRRKKDYIALLISAPDGICGDILQNILKQDGPSPEFYKAFICGYQTKNCNTSVYEDEIWAELAAMKSEEQKATTLGYVKRDFSDGVATVYRGWGENSSDPFHAASWTTSINVAVWFACNRGGKPAVTVGKVRCEDIIEYTPGDSDAGNEAEVIIRPGSLIDGVTTRLMDGNDERLSKHTDKIIEIFTQYKNLLVKVYRKDVNKYHGAEHSCRVLIHSLILADMCGLDALDKVRLAEAAVYHDAGRVTDNEAEGHGRASAKLYEKRGDRSLNDPLVAFIMEAHSIDDDKAEGLLSQKTDIRPADREKAMQLLRILKDADALDRVRFGRCGEGDGLDVRFLRCKDAWMLVPFAYECLSMLKLPEGDEILYKEYTQQSVRWTLREYFAPN